jgi:hypothetical protein
MARFEDNAPATGRYIDGDERSDYIDRPMRMQSARFQPKALYGPRWVIEAVMLDDGELVAIALADNPTRQARFGEVAASLAADGHDAYEPVCLFKQDQPGGGNPFWTFRSATDAELELAADLRESGGQVDDDNGEPDEPEAAPKGKARK